jgi:4-methyl-5(b-hydroxyethyl)-thiazole monophosphate biosynthesis
MKKVCVLLARGCEEVEAVTPIDYLRRAGAEVITAGVGGTQIQGAHGITITAQADLNQLQSDEFDCIVIPGGGPGSAALAADGHCVAFIRRHAAANKMIAAICAAPALVLGEACGLLAGRRFTCYPGMESRVPGGVFSEGRVVQDGQFISSRGPGCAGEFSIAIIRALIGDQAAEQVASAVLLV